MNLIKLASVTISLDHVAFWTVTPKADFVKPPDALRYNATRYYPPTDEPIVVIVFAAEKPPLTLWVDAAKAFLAAMRERDDIKDAHFGPTSAPTAPSS